MNISIGYVVQWHGGGGGGKRLYSAKYWKIPYILASFPKYLTFNLELIFMIKKKPRAQNLRQ